MTSHSKRSTRKSGSKRRGPPNPSPYRRRSSSKRPGIKSAFCMRCSYVRCAPGKYRKYKKNTFRKRKSNSKRKSKSK